ncbi:MAG: metal ABC transporter permease [Microbacteriaceae bacterium]|nr:metal ABC transporter permease [Microbacteriaceae bacterium]
MTDLATMLSAPFMQQAVLALVLVSTIAAFVGVLLNLRDLEFVSDGLVHAVFPGVVIGFVTAGVDGVYLGAIVAAVIGTVLLTFAARRGLGEDAATAVLLAGAFAIGIVIVSRTTRYSSGVEQLLFGQLLTVGRDDLLAIGVLGGLALVIVLATWKEQVLVAFDRTAAAATGMRVVVYELALNLAIALVVVAASRAIGNLLVLALLIVPAAVGRLVSRRLGVVVAVALAVPVLTGPFGLALAYWLSVDARLQISPSALVVLVLVGVYLVVAATTTLGRRLRRDREPTASEPPATTSLAEVVRP